MIFYVDLGCRGGGMWGRGAEVELLGGAEKQFAMLLSLTTFIIADCLILGGDEHNNKPE